MRGSAILIAAFLAACSQAPESGPSIQATEAFIVAPPAGRDVTGGGLVLTASGEAYTVVAARTSVAKTVELHTMTSEDGMMMMRQVEELSVPDGATLTLGPGGDHLMFFGVSEPLEQGGTITLQLDVEGETSGAETLEIEAEVRPFGAR